MEERRDENIQKSEPPMEEIRSQVRGLLELEEFDELKKFLQHIEPEDVAEILGDFSAGEKLLIFNSLKVSDAAVVLDDTDPQSRLQILQKLDSGVLSEVLDEMPVDEAADIIEEASKKEREDLLDLMEKEDAEEVEEILSYPEDSAARVMNPDLIAVRESDAVEDAIRHIRSLEVDEDVFYVYVVDADEKLKGTVPIRKLLTVQKGTLIKDIMEGDAHYIQANADQEEAARIIKKYDVASLPVVDTEGVLLGRITVDDIIDVLDEERGEDISHMTGTMEEEQGTESTFMATRNRLPWLVTCMLGSILTGLVIQMFEVTLQELIALVCFIPVITATGGNSGVQASTVVVREIALGSMDLSKVGDEIWRQFKIALGLAVICGTLLSVLANFWKKNSLVGFIVGLSIFLVVVWSNFVGVLIPLLFKKFKIDPAIASGPLITTLNDVVGVFIYLSVATLFLS